MKAGEKRLSRQVRQLALAAASALSACALLSGCAVHRAAVEKHLMADAHTANRSAGVVEHYLVGCPDALGIVVAGRPDLSRTCRVGPDGRIDLGDDLQPRVEGKTAVEIAPIIADELDLAADDVGVRIAEYNSQHLILIGQVIGWQRTVPYQGQETVLDVLQRVGGITPGAAPDDVYVVRAHVADGRRPEVFHVDLAAIVMKQDQSTNLRVQPFDQIYVGETRQARIEKCIPPWLRPVYQAVWHSRPIGADAVPPPQPPRPLPTKVQQESAPLGPPI